jgi:hypothetical protein
LYSAKKIIMHPSLTSSTPPNKQKYHAPKHLAFPMFSLVSW